MVPSLELGLTAGDRPRVVVGHSLARYMLRAGEELSQWGWEVFPTASGPQARRLVHRVRPQLVLLEADLPEESGWLTCAKLTCERPRVAVVLVSESVGPREKAFAAFVGAAGVVERRRALAAVLPPVAGMIAGEDRPGDSESSLGG